MGWFGTLIGSSLGFMFGGPLGAIGGAALGHVLLDRRSTHTSTRQYNSHETRQAGYFVALFSLMGKIASADGHISTSEKQVVKQFIAQSQMNSAQGEYALRIFEEAAHSSHTIKDLINQFYLLTAGQSQYHLNFMDFLVRIAAADGTVDANETRVLHQIAAGLYIGDENFRIILNRATTNRQHGNKQYSQTAPHTDTLHNAYNTLGCTPQSSEDDIRTAYRSLAAAYHPDKIIAKDLPEEFTELANKKFQDIQTAYERVKEARNIR